VFAVLFDSGLSGKLAGGALAEVVIAIMLWT
jgi:hypothetical protein